MAKSKDKIVIICYNQAEEWESRKQAKAFYMDCMFNSEGSEQERYVNIFRQLEEGQDLCIDDDCLTPKAVQNILDKGIKKKER